jgi:hypothetical protein
MWSGQSVNSLGFRALHWMIWLVFWTVVCGPRADFWVLIKRSSWELRGSALEKVFFVQILMSIGGRINRDVGIKGLEMKCRGSKTRKRPILIKIRKWTKCPRPVRTTYFETPWGCMWLIAQSCNRRYAVRGSAYFVCSKMYWQWRISRLMVVMCISQSRERM